MATARPLQEAVMLTIEDLGPCTTEQIVADLFGSGAAVRYALRELQYTKEVYRFGKLGRVTIWGLSKNKSGAELPPRPTRPDN